jgi:hypothetical protein
MQLLHPTGETTAAIAAEIAQYASDKLGGLEGETMDVYVPIDDDDAVAWPPMELDDEHAEADSGGDVYVSSDPKRTAIHTGRVYAAYTCRITQGIENPAYNRRVMADAWSRIFKESKVRDE